VSVGTIATLSMTDGTWTRIGADEAKQFANDTLLSPSRSTTGSGARECEATRPDGAALEFVLQAWSDLAPPLKSAILAMVRAANGGRAR